MANVKLPQAYILIWLINQINNTSNQIDQVISAEVPDFDIHPYLFEVITKNLIHGPCE